ncbi:hypothetical protein [Streptomyces hawaiiensis]|uniref:hypothetical protein n=1 Tax=Streptomyces hawaiiensis TaxID=67305 RepID=UPI003648628D
MRDGFQASYAAEVADENRFTLHAPVRQVTRRGHTRCSPAEGVTVSAPRTTRALPSDGATVTTRVPVTAARDATTAYFRTTRDGDRVTVEAEGVPGPWQVLRPVPFGLAGAGLCRRSASL